jgi:hypothetical protein
MQEPPRNIIAEAIGGKMPDLKELQNPVPPLMQEQPKKEEFRYKHAKSSWMSAIDNLDIVREICSLGARDGNIEDYMKEGGYGAYVFELGEPPEGQGNFISATPVVYALYNAMEMILKGYEHAAYPNARMTKVYKLPELIKNFKERAYSSEAEMNGFLDKYLNDDKLPALMAAFFKESGKTVDDIVNMRRYIGTNNYFNAVTDNFKALYYTPEEGKAFFNEVLDDIKPVGEHVTALQLDINEDGKPGELVSALQIG